MSQRCQPLLNKDSAHCPQACFVVLFLLWVLKLTEVLDQLEAGRHNRLLDVVPERL
jgi:hypothetical protein